jgi:hypothetical protein
VEEVEPLRLFHPTCPGCFCTVTYQPAGVQTQTGQIGVELLQPLGQRIGGLVRPDLQFEGG